MSRPKLKEKPFAISKRVVWDAYEMLEVLYRTGTEARAAMPF